MIINFLNLEHKLSFSTKHWQALFLEIPKQWPRGYSCILIWTRKKYVLWKFEKIQAIWLTDDL